MFSLLSKPFVVAWYDTSEEYLLVFGLLLLAALYGEYKAESDDKRLAATKKQKRLFEENENLHSAKRLDSIFKKYKRFLGVMVVISVLGELLADGGIFAFGRILQIISERENSVMALQVANIGTTNAQLVVSNSQLSMQVEQLRSNNFVLQAKVNPRTISVKQMEDFIFLTEKINKKIPIVVHRSSWGDDTFSFSAQTRYMLDKAGFVRDSSQGGVATDAERPVYFTPWRELGSTDEVSSVIFCNYGTNKLPKVDFFPLENTNGFVRPIILEQNAIQVYEALASCFNQAGISAKWIENAKPLSSAETTFEIYVPPKNF